MDLDLSAVRTFLAVVDDGRFTDAADRLGMTQQAVSKRVARLEADLGVALLNRSRTGVVPTEDGAAFLPHARALVGLADQAVTLLRARRRPLRVDVLAKGAAPIDIVRAFHEAGDVDLDVVVSGGAFAQLTALAEGSVDVVFGRARGPLPPGIRRVPACLEPIPALAGRRHPLASDPSAPTSALAGVTAWLPGLAPDSEWAEYYRFFSAEFGVRVDHSGPFFGGEHMVERIAAADDLVTFGTTRQFPVHPEVVQVALVDPTPVYPWSLMWHEANSHPSLPPFVDHVRAGYRPIPAGARWLPAPDRALFPRVVATRSAGPGFAR